MTKPRYPGLDGLRGLAAFAVILHHTAIKRTDMGGLAVFLFFALSGFLVTDILIRARAKIESGATTRRDALLAFWIQRALRIFPAYYFWLLVFLPFDALLFGGQTLAHLPWYLFYAQNFLIGFVTFAWQDFTHTWSLAVEQQYYVFFAPLALLAPSRWRQPLFVAAILVCLCVTGAAALLGYQPITLYPLPSTGFVFMAVGALLAATPRETLAAFAYPASVAATLSALTLLALYPLLERAQILHAPYPLLVFCSAAAVGAALAATLAAPTSRGARWLEAPVLKFLGKISYAMYVVHLPIAYWAQEKSNLSFLGAPTGLLRDLAEFVIVAPASIALATASWRWVESPFLALKERLKQRTE